MGPVVPTKRKYVGDGDEDTSASKRSPPKPTLHRKAKQTVFDAVDAATDRKNYEDSRGPPLTTLSTSDDESLSDISSDEFEDVKQPAADPAEDEDEEDWEDAMESRGDHDNHVLENTDEVRGEPMDLELTLPDASTTYIPEINVSGRKGPSKTEREMRILIHKVHVVFLLYHNFLRNWWMNDQAVRDALMRNLSGSVKEEINNWKRSMGMAGAEVQGQAPQEVNRGKGTSDRRSQDWSGSASRTEEGKPDLSRGDPTSRFLRYIASHWRKRFRITAPGLRKRGYLSVKDVETEIKSFQQSHDFHDRFGEHIESLDEFKAHAESLTGSRDLGTQLFVSLLRELGFEARLSCNLQPLGFGWSKIEDVDAKKLRKVRSAQQKESEAGGKASRSGREPVPAEGSDELSLGEKEFPYRPKKIDNDLTAPNYWVEVLSPVTNRYIPVSVFPNILVGQSDDLDAFIARGKAANESKQTIAYVVAFSTDGSAKDVTVRYLKNRRLPGKAKGFRVPIEKIPLYNSRGKVIRVQDFDWFSHILRAYARPSAMRTDADELEDNEELKPVEDDAKQLKAKEETLQWYKTSAEFVLERHLRREEAIRPGVRPVRHFIPNVRSKKGDEKPPVKPEPVYFRKDVLACRTAESWHKEGRQVIAGTDPLKMVPTRAVTILRKRALEEIRAQTGEAPTQGLYSKDQTEWIIPDPIEDGKIPRNSFGNIDVYVPTMVPRGAVHLKLRGAARVCKKLGIDHAEACVGFEFGGRIAVPILHGVVVAEDNVGLVTDAWRHDMKEKEQKEKAKMRKKLLTLWAKFARGLVVWERVKNTYGEED
ncbi:Rad4-domain-containing protein, partial [Eremomyces bilateralis CBS 781.70]